MKLRTKKIKRLLTGFEMHEMEREVCTNPDLYNLRGKSLNELKALALEYKLEIITSDKRGTRIALLPPQNISDDYNGRIQLRWPPSRFDIMHELLHYILDVGIGNVVTDACYEDYSPHRESSDPNERKINYMAAALLMPFDEMEIAIQAFDEKQSSAFTQQFISDLEDQYDVNGNCVVTRIQEVRKQMHMRKQGMI